MSTRYAHMALAGLAAIAACEESSSLIPDPLPDLSGSWTLTMVGAPVGSPPERGNCLLEPVSVQLAQTGEDPYRQAVSGSQSGGSMICHDLSDEDFASAGMTDSILSLPPGTVSGEVGWECHSERTLLPWEECDGALFPFATIQMHEQTLSGGAETTSLTGSFHWISGGAVRVTGTWLAVR